MMCAAMRRVAMSSEDMGRVVVGGRRAYLAVVAAEALSNQPVYHRVELDSSLCHLETA